MQATKVGGQGRSCTTLRIFAVHAPGTSIQHQLQLAGCRAVATGTLQAYTSSFNCQLAGKRRGDRTHTEMSLPPATVVAKCGGFAPCLSWILWIVSWWPHGAHTGPLGTSFWGGSLGLPPFLVASDAISGFFVFGSISPHGPQLAESICG